MIIKTAEFSVSNSDYRKCPAPNIPEYAFIGRSNVGKSSLINMLCNHKELARTSSSPGKTQLINHFIINKNWFLVDLPGYGYAKISKTSRAKWMKMVSDYLTMRPNLMSVFVLIDSRIPPQDIDIEFINNLGMWQVPFAIIFTKRDKSSEVKMENLVEEYKAKLADTWEEFPPYFISSAIKKIGREEILNYIGEVNKLFKQ
jgi:GTP-binding protein